MRKIAVVNQKGGVGKTTVSINLSAAIAAGGRRVLLVDMDPQSHCAVGTAVPEEQIKRSVFDCLKSVRDERPTELSEAVWQITPHLDLAVSQIDLSKLEGLEAGKDDSATLLERALGSVEAKYDFAVIDCPPHLGVLMRNALYTADEVIVPVETGYFSLHGLTKQMETLREIVKTHGRRPRVRILANQYDVRTKLAREILAELRRQYSDYVLDTVVNFNTKLKEGASFGQPITEFAPESTGARDFQALAREVAADRPAAIASAASVGRYAERLAADSNRLLATTTPLIGRNGAAKRRDGDAAVLGGKNGSTESVRSLREEHERIDRKLESVYGVRQTPEGVLFRTAVPGARVVQLAGEFNEWMPHTTPLSRRGDSDVFETMLQLTPGRYRYRLVVDGRWAYDRENPDVETNEYGEINSVVEVSVVT